MLTISELTTLLGWASVLNIAYLGLAALAMMFMRGVLFSVHGKMFDIDEKEPPCVSIVVASILFQS